MAISIPTMPRPAERELARLARELGHSLPPGYIWFANLHDGAKPEDNSLITSNNEVGVSRFVAAKEALGLAASIQGFPAGVVLLAEDDCGNYFYVRPDTGSVHFWDHEVEGPDEQLAPDVGAFLEKLTPFDPSQVKLAPGQVKSVWIDPSFKPEF